MQIYPRYRLERADQSGGMKGSMGGAWWKIQVHDRGTTGHSREAETCWATACHSEKHLEQADIYFKCKGKKPLTEAEQILFTTAKDYLKGVMNGKTTIPTKAWKEEYTKLTAERKPSISGILHWKRKWKKPKKSERAFTVSCGRNNSPTESRIWSDNGQGGGIVNAYHRRLVLDFY